jgi:hypothetical protein
MVRLRATDWNSKKRERKEYMYYFETWDAKNWRGHPIEKGRSSEHIEGKYDEVLTKPKYHEMAAILKLNLQGQVKSITFHFQKRK